MAPVGLRERPWVKALLIAVAIGYIAILLLLPLGAVLTEAFKKGLEV